MATTAEGLRRKARKRFAPRPEFTIEDLMAAWEFGFLAAENQTDDEDGLVTRRIGRPMWSGTLRSVESAIEAFETAMAPLPVRSRPIPLNDQVAVRLRFIDPESRKPDSKYWRYRKRVKKYLATHPHVGSDLIRQFFGLATDHDLR